MGQKIHPFIFRVILNRNWNCSWYTPKYNFSSYLIEDIKIRKFLLRVFKSEILGKIIIQKSLENIFVTLYVKNKLSLIEDNFIDINQLQDQLSNYVKKNVYINIKNIINPNVNPYLILLKIKKKIETRKSHKNTIKNIMLNVFKSGALGIKIIIKGRINGNIMTRKQSYKQGKVPLHKISSNIKYFSGVATTNYGSIGIKVWIYLGDFIYYN